MSDLNMVALVGRLGEIAVSNHNGTQIANVSIATREHRKVNNEFVETTHWFDIAAFGMMADKLISHGKGALVSVKGQLKQEKWEKDGQKRSKVSILVESAQLLAKPQAQSAQQQGDYQQAQQPQGGYQQPQQAQQQGGYQQAQQPQGAYQPPQQGGYQAQQPQGNQPQAAPSGHDFSNEDIPF
ncbi:single-stranded DNA-binding protein [uncultured Umboniibacter sp.]|uniref:single-stranded DNA-binding protein n=1 Tax=uncultured Umboniibacter sp. TaxID=1798917 RepID=UPI00262E0115|nr:single-stranded DNA-binding protein [uncultured Umboniibacter sp.]